jgi:NAD(P)-dependent dehydrogenase (short-subunit alcohol dehydrogenase family)
MPQPVCVVTGVGPGTGASLTRIFAREGYLVAMLARSADRLNELEKEIPGARAYPTDVGDPASVKATFAAIRGALGPVDVLLHNAGSGAFHEFEKLSPAEFEAAWRINALGLLACGQEAAADMALRGSGAIIITGATASLRGGALTAGFAPAKAAQRSLAQSMAKSLGPKGVHVALVIVDGVIDIPKTRAFLPDKPDDFFLQPESIAETVLHLVRQDRSAWTFELDIRPYAEKW